MHVNDICQSRKQHNIEWFVLLSLFNKIINQLYLRWFHSDLSYSENCCLYFVVKTYVFFHKKKKDAKNEMTVMQVIQ